MLKKKLKNPEIDNEERDKINKLLQRMVKNFDFSIN